ncbi:MAG: 2-oxo acid dehydrogenase subunit E2 [Chloroflexota bacterium]
MSEQNHHAAPGEDAVGPRELEPSDTVRLSGLRATIARRLTRSAAAPMVTLTTEVDVTAAVALQRQLVDEWRPHRIRPQFQDLALAATAHALAEHPYINAHLVDDEVRRYSSVNLGFAVSVPDGLLALVIHEAQEKSALEIAGEVRGLMNRLKAGDLHVQDMKDATFTVTNLGAVGVDAFNPILDPPQIGILGAGRVVRKPAEHDGEIALRSMCWLSLTFDHRAIDGYPAGEFLRAVGRGLENPEWMRSGD